MGDLYEVFFFNMLTKFSPTFFIGSIMSLFQGVKLLEEHLSLEGPMWSDPKVNTKPLWFGFMALVIMVQGNSLLF